MEGGEGLADRRRRAATGRKVRGIHAIARKEVDDDGPGIAESRFAEQFGSTEGQQTADARRQRTQGARLGGEFGAGIRVGRSAHDDASSVIEFGERGVVATGRALGENADSDDAHPGQSRGHGRG